MVFASSEQSAPIGNTSGSDHWNGIVFQGNSGQVYGNVTLAGNLTIANGQTLTVPNGSTLTIPQGVTLTNNGAVTNQGTIENYGTISGNNVSNSGGTVKVPATVEVSVSPTTAPYGSTVTLTATVTSGDNQVVTSGTVNFYRETNTSGTPLNSTPAQVGSNGQATYNLTLNDTNWTPRDTAYTITAVYSGNDALLEGSDTAELTVNQASQTAPGENEGYSINYSTETITADSDYELATSDDATTGSGSLPLSPRHHTYYRLRPQGCDRHPQRLGLGSSHHPRPTRFHGPGYQLHQRDHRHRYDDGVQHE